MHPLIFILILLPGTGLHDWYRALDSSEQSALVSNIGLMNARTAETDKITPNAACRTIAAGARMTAGDTDQLPYPADPNNLSASLKASGVVCEANDDLARLIAGRDALPIAASKAPSQFIVYDFGDDIKAADAYAKSVESNPAVRIIAVSPCPSRSAYAQGYQLTPISNWRVTGDVITSPSTRTDNLVTNTDIAPTISKAFGVTLRTPPFGASITTAAAEDPIENRGYVTDLQSQSVRQYRKMQWLPYVALALSIVIAAASRRFLANRTIDKWVGVPFMTAFVMTSTWLSLFFVPWPVLAILGVVLIAVASPRLVETLAGFVTIGLLVDAIFFQGRVTGGSMLGYSPIEGARYYGVGNEIMGYWIGATTLFCARMAENARYKYLVLAIAIAVIVALGLPDAGAKAGGFLVGLLTLGAALWARSGRTIRPLPAAAGVIGALIAGSGLLVLFGRLFGASHVTEAAGMVRSEGISSLVDLIARKAGMDLHLVFHSVWMLVLLASGIASYLALKPIWRRPELPRAEVAGLITATVASFALNDAGVVAGALCSISLWSSAMLLHSRFTRAARAAQEPLPDTPATSLSS